MSATQSQQQPASEVSGLFDRIKSSASFFDVVKSTPESTLDYLKQCVASLRIGKGTPPEIESAAFIAGQQMLAEDLTFAELRMKYHIYPDKLALRSEWIHAEIVRQGWSFAWTADGEDGKKAIFTASKNGVSKSSEFTIELAKRKDLLKHDSGWQKDPAQMLRARAITRWATMYAPQIGAGMGEDAEHGESVELDSSEVSGVPQSQAKSTTTTVATEPAKQTQTQPAASTSTQPAKSKPVTLDSPTSVLEFSPRAFEAFAIAPAITSIGMLCQFSREQLEGRVASLKGVGKKKAETIVTEICTTLGGAGFDLKSSSANQSGGDSAVDAESATPEARTDASALAAKGAELASDSDANHGDNLHGQLIAEIREICADDGEKAFAKIIMGERCGGATSLADLSAIQSATVLIHLLARAAGMPIEKVDGAMQKIMAAEVPIDAATKALAQIRSRLPGKK